MAQRVIVARPQSQQRRVGTRLERTSRRLGDVKMAAFRIRAKSLRRIAQAAAFVVAAGITISFGARSFASTVELADRPMAREVPESAELFGTGAVLVVMAASARRVVRREPDAEEDRQSL